MGALEDIGDLAAVVVVATFLAVSYAFIIILQFILENWIAIVLIFCLCGFVYFLYRKQEKRETDQNKSLNHS